MLQILINKIPPKLQYLVNTLPTNLGRHFWGPQQRQTCGELLTAIRQSSSTPHVTSEQLCWLTRSRVFVSAILLLLLTLPRSSSLYPIRPKKTFCVCNPRVCHGPALQSLSNYPTAGLLTLRAWASQATTQGLRDIKFQLHFGSVNMLWFGPENPPLTSNGIQSPNIGLNLTVVLWKKHPYPYRGGGRGGTKPTCRIPLFLLGNLGIVIQPLEWNCKVTFLNKPWALVRKYLRLALEELSASMITAAQFFGGMPSLHMCCFSLTCV